MKKCACCERESEDDAIFCGECGTKFEPLEPTEDRRQLEDPALSLVIVATFRNLEEAGPLKARLESAGIEACIPEEYTPQIFWTFMPTPLQGVTVRVAAKDYEAAKALYGDNVDTALTAPHPGESVSEKPTAPESSTAGGEAADLQGGKRCVACSATIPEDAGLCPKCGWTQPDRTGI